MALEFGIIDESGGQVIKTEISASGGSQDVKHRGIDVGHVVYPGDCASDKGGLTYVRILNPPMTYEINFEKGQTEDFPAYLIGLLNGTDPIDDRGCNLHVVRK